MSEIRKDPVSGRWVIISAERQGRPNDFTMVPPTLAGREQCPFCPGHEVMTPPEILADRHGTVADAPGWDLRVVPNRYPALRHDGVSEVHRDGLLERIDGVGAHEVIIETPDHDKWLATMSVEEIERVLTAYGRRLRDLRHDGRLQYVLIFKNHGAAAGATLAHPHSQLIGLPMVPDVVREEIEGARRHFSRTKRCIFCDLLESERRDGRRIVEDGDAVVALAPYAARFAHETWLLPARHASRFEDDGATYPALARSLKSVLTRLDRVLHAPPFNLILHTAPCAEDQAEGFHWHMEIVPKIQRVAGFEWGTGFYINPVAPEASASLLRDVQL